MSRQVGFTHRSVNGLHTSICLACFRTAGRSPHSPALAIYETVHECHPSDLETQPTEILLSSTDHADARCSDLPLAPDSVVTALGSLSPALQLLAPIAFQSNPSA